MVRFVTSSRPTKDIWRNYGFENYFFTADALPFAVKITMKDKVFDSCKVRVLPLCCASDWSWERNSPAQAFAARCRSCETPSTDQFASKLGLTVVDENVWREEFETTQIFTAWWEALGVHPLQAVMQGAELRSFLENFILRVMESKILLASPKPIATR